MTSRLNGSTIRTVMMWPFADEGSDCGAAVSAVTSSAPDAGGAEPYDESLLSSRIPLPATGSLASSFGWEG